MMSSLTPDVALAYVRELSADVRAGIVLDAHGERLAGAPELHAPAKHTPRRGALARASCTASAETGPRCS